MRVVRQEETKGPSKSPIAEITDFEFHSGRLCQATVAVSVNSGFQFVLIRAIRERQEIPAEESLLIRGIYG